MTTSSTRLSNLRKYLATAKGVVLETATYEVIDDLKEKGPYWSGTFERSWVGVAGNTSIPQIVQPPPERLSEPATRLTTPPSVTRYQPGTSVNNYTIGNETTYRALAQDLIPGSLPRIKGGGNQTAIAHWYRLYLSSDFGGTVKASVRAALIGDPRLRSFS